MTEGRKRARHDGPKCGGKLKHRDGTCTQPAGWGTSHQGAGNCKLHGGSTPNGVKAAQREAAGTELARWGLPVITTAADALDGELYRTVGRVRYCAVRVTSLAEADLADSPWPGMERWERRHLADLARNMIALDLDGRQVELTELFGQRLATALELAMTGAGLAIETRGRVLQLLAGGLESGDG